jgi:hypothetical protein
MEMSRELATGLMQANLMAAIVLVFSFGMAVQFFVHYCRSLLAVAGKLPLSERVREALQMQEEQLTRADCRRVWQLAELCPEMERRSRQLSMIRAYSRVLCLSRRLFSWTSASVSRWFEAEQQSCARFVAVVLDRRMAHTQSLLKQDSY